MVLVSGQLLFLVNFVWSLFAGRKAAGQPVGGDDARVDDAARRRRTATSARVPIVHRWAYEYGVQTVAGDFAVQTVPASATGDAMAARR